ncbi:MAG: hypothetical protein WA124_13395 [Smithella sp.]
MSNWQDYACLQFGTLPSSPFSFHSTRYSIPYDEFKAQKLENISNVIYGTADKIMNEHIMARRQVWKKKNLNL